MKVKCSKSFIKDCIYHIDRYHLRGTTFCIGTKVYLLTKVNNMYYLSTGEDTLASGTKKDVADKLATLDIYNKEVEGYDA